MALNLGYVPPSRTELSPHSCRFWHFLAIESAILNRLGPNLIWGYIPRNTSLSSFWVYVTTPSGAEQCPPKCRFRPQFSIDLDQIWHEGRYLQSPAQARFWGMKYHPQGQSHAHLSAYFSTLMIPAAIFNRFGLKLGMRVDIHEYSSSLFWV